MPVYVDDMAAPFGNMIMCHMIADTHRELMAMAKAIGVGHHWIQSPGTYGEHFDIAQSKRALAVAHGAIEITWRDCAQRCSARRSEESRRAYYQLPENDSAVDPSGQRPNLPRRHAERRVLRTPEPLRKSIHRR